MERTLLVAVDPDDANQRTIDVALELAVALGAAVVLLHVVPIPEGLAPSTTVASPGDAPPEGMRLVREATAALDGMRPLFEGAGVEVRTEVETGVPADTIVAVAERLRPDLLVIGTHGRRGLRRWVLGSVAEQVIRHAPCPVVTTRDVGRE